MKTIAPPTPAELIEQAKNALYLASNIMACVKIENDYQENAYKSVLDAYHALARYQMENGGANA